MRTRRLRALALTLAAGILLIVARLVQMQIVEGERWEREAHLSRLTKRTLGFRRGRILDRDGRVLARDRVAYDLRLRYRDFRRGHPLGQMHAMLMLTGAPPRGLVEAARHAAALADHVSAWEPRDLARLPARDRDDVLFYLERLLDGGVPGATDEALEEWVRAADDRLLEEILPGTRAALRARLEEGAAAIVRLETALGGVGDRPLLDEIEAWRLELERRIHDLALRRALERALPEPGARAVRAVLGEVLAAEGGHEGAGANAVAEARLRAEEWLAALRARWWPPCDDDALLRLLVSGGTLAETGPVLAAIEEHAPADLAGVRRMLLADVQRNRTRRLARDLPYAAVDLLAQEAARFPGLYAEENPRRVYPEGVAPQLVGSVGLASERDLERWRDEQEEFAALRREFFRSPEEERRYRELRHRLWARAIRPDERRGVRGIELVFEEVLRGRRGYLQVLAGGAEDARPLELVFSPPRHGLDVVLSLDADLQRAAEEAIVRAYEEAPARLREDPTVTERMLADFDPRRIKAGFVILDLRDGSTPVLATWPTYDPGALARDPAAVFEDPLRPTRHRALGGGYRGREVPYPGSTFKPLVAAIALERDPRAWERELTCGGVFTAPGTDRALQCDSFYGHGSIDMRDALKLSCNVYFYRLALELGYEAIWERAASLGFGEYTGIELVQRAAGEGEAQWRGDVLLEKMPYALWSPERVRGNPMTTMRTAIGQVGVKASPLQMARFFGWVATGELHTPRLVLESHGAVGARPLEPEVTLDAAVRARLRDALVAVVEEPGGTAHRTDFAPAWEIAGKTGTAQVQGGENHAWFAGWFPADAPRYAYAVLCENTGLHGGQIASHVLRAFLDGPGGAELLGEVD